MKTQICKTSVTPACYSHQSLQKIMLIESYKNGGSLLIQGPDHCSLLHHAAKTGNGEIVKYILDHGPSELLDMADSETGETALHKAACQRNRAVCQLLVDAGASLRKTDSKVTQRARASILPLGEMAGSAASACACSTGTLSVLMEVPGALEKRGKNRVLHSEKLHFKCINTKGGCACLWGFINL
uniref:Diacylglycerol kinase iota n=1 Tax=Oryctolagus cuniculus TaxID=9986 RepID=A0A5F9CB98_RABIT